MSKSKQSKQYRQAKLLKRRKRSPALQVNQTEILEQLGAETRTLFDMEDTRFVMNPEDEVKMSDVLWEFITPYYDERFSQDQTEKLLTLGIMAWNTSFLDETERLAEIRRFAETIGESPAVMRTLLEPLIRDKLQHFPDYDRKFINFHLKDLGKRVHLSVVTTLPQNARNSHWSDGDVHETA